jgi:AraC-like DNA-binding protein
VKVLPFKIPKPEPGALVYQEDRATVLYDKLHQHEEIQISFVQRGRGHLIVGDTINDYMTNDILVIGSNVPHVFRSDPRAYRESVLLTLFFTKDSFGRDFFNLPDLRNIASFFKDSDYGMRILSNQKELITLFKRLENQNKIERIASLLILLDIISRSKRKALSTFIYKKNYTDDEGKRMRAVFDYTMQHFKEGITLEDIALKANMTKNAFCRYFKKRTNKTYFQFLIEIRIENACRLLYNRDLSILSVSELSGFQNIGNFNRKFKELKGVSPSAFRSGHRR